LNGHVGPSQIFSEPSAFIAHNTAAMTPLHRGNRIKVSPAIRGKYSERKRHSDFETVLKYQNNRYGDMPDNKDCQPRSGVIGAKMAIRFAA